MTTTTKPGPLMAVGRLIDFVDPVFIAPHGDRFHHAPVTFYTLAGPVAWADGPTCGAPADRWVAIDRTFAELLDRQACGLCWPEGKPDQLSISDTEIPDKEGTP